MVKITFKDGVIKKFPKGIAVLTIAKELSVSLGKACCGGLINGIVVDLRFKINQDCQLFILTKQDLKSLDVLRHSMSHILAAAITNLWPGAKFGVGPAVTDGFYYDVDVKPKIKAEELVLIEKEITKIIKAKYPIIKEILPRKVALKMFKNDEYKMEIIGDLPNDEVISVYRIGDKYVDLCKGPHLQNTSYAKYFKLTSIAGSYWRGDSNRVQLQRIYGTAFFNQNNLTQHLIMLEERKERDHRKLGKELKIFMMNQLAGQGCPTWLPNGFQVVKVLKDYIYQKELDYNHTHVATPIIGSVDLYKTSGHWEHYQENMFPIMRKNDEELVLRPMTCPHHMLIFKSALRSYRDLPIRYAENAILHRYEASGGLTGLERVRAMELADTHSFVREDQIKNEIKYLWKMINEVITKLDLKISYVELALQGPTGKYHKNKQLWNKAETQLQEVLEELEIEYTPMIDEAAFYGPKIDFQVKTALGRIITLSTLQIDFLLPERFALNYINQNGEKIKPVIIHRGLVGTYERLISILLEQTKGALPIWLAPVQVIILPINNKYHLKFAKDLKVKLTKYQIRTKLDDRDERLGYKIRDAQTMKIPFQIVIGDKELKKTKINIRQYGSKEELDISVDKLIKLIIE